MPIYIQQFNISIYESESEPSEEEMLPSQGLKFPWESAVSGREVCPEDIYGQQEIHINGDVSLAFQTYLYLTEVSAFTTIPLSALMWGC